MPAHAEPTWPDSASDAASAPAQAIDDGAADAVLGKQHHQQAETDHAVRRRQNAVEIASKASATRRNGSCIARGRPRARWGTAPSREGGQRRHHADLAIAESLLTEIKGQEGEREADARHAEQVGAVESDAVAKVHLSLSKSDAKEVPRPLSQLTRLRAD